MPDLHQRVAPIDRPDQSAVEADLAIYFGHQAEVYLRHYRRQHGRHRAGRRGPVAAWSWPAFSASLAWFWYRKLWLGGVLSLAIPMVGEWLPGGWGGVAGGSLYDLLLKNGVSFGSIEQVVSATLADPVVAARLQIEVGSPLLQIRRMHFDTRQQPVEYLEQLAAPGSFELRMSLQPGELRRWTP